MMASGAAPDEAPRAAGRRRRQLAAALAVVAAALAGALAYTSFDDDRSPPRPPGPAASREEEKQAHVRARLSLDRAQQALADGDLVTARELANEARALDAKAADAVRVLAVIEKRAGRTDEACRLMRDYVRRAATPEPARARLLASACDEAAPKTQAP